MAVYGRFLAPEEVPTGYGIVLNKLEGLAAQTAALALDQSGSIGVARQSAIAVIIHAMLGMAVHHPDWIAALYESLSPVLREQCDAAAEGMIDAIPLGESR